MTQVRISLEEWSKVGPQDNPLLAGLNFDEHPSARTLAEELSRSDIIEAQELAHGLFIRSTSHVGSVDLGPVHLTITPKITGMPLLTLLRYAYGLRDLRLGEDVEYEVSGSPFRDLLLRQLLREAKELIARGLHRRYQPSDEELVSPRGRFSFGLLARRGGVTQATLPCRHHPRLTDCLPNQVLLSGLELGVQSTEDTDLRTRLRRVAALLSNGISRIELSDGVFAQLSRQANRLTRSYRPAFQLIEMLFQGGGPVLNAERGRIRLPGFLFDMNRFFQALMGRFLQEHLPEHSLREEYRLKGMFSYVPGFNPQRKQAPTPRPDFVVFGAEGPIAILDAKYRDLWAQSLPRDMLYQLALYALSQRRRLQAIILYPTLDTLAQEARIEVREPLVGTAKAEVVLRPADLNRLAELVRPPSSARRTRACTALAHRFVFGEPTRGGMI